MNKTLAVNKTFLIFFSYDIIQDNRDMTIQNDTIFNVNALKVDAVTFFQIRFLGIRFSLSLIAFRSSYWS